MVILGIETSCDETAAAVVTDGPRLVSESLATQFDIHAKFGGVVPELACRSHVEAIDRIVEQALCRAGVSVNAIDAVAVTEGPGLVGALLVGISFAKAFAYAVGRPLLGINHLEGHIVAPVLSGQDLRYPSVALIVSGGHTHLYHVASFGRYRLIGRTIDDAAGEAFDKAAAYLGLGYPGGPAIDRLSKDGDPRRYRFPRPMTGRGASHQSFDMSFSGLKTAFVHAVRQADPGESGHADLAASFQEAVVDVLADKVLAAARHYRVEDIIIGGGVAANSRLRTVLAERATREGLRLTAPAPMHCIDNAGMIAAAAWYRSRGDLSPSLDLNAQPSLALE